MSTCGTVLLIDDDPESRLTLTQALGPLGYQVEEAENGAAGLTKARLWLPDVILLDVMMPGMDGFAVCRQLKGDAETRLIPVVFLTGLDSRAARLQGLEMGATDFLHKPFDLVELETRVRNLVTFRRLTQELDSAEQMLFAIARVVEARDESTGEHCDRLSMLAADLGQSLGLDEESVKALRRAGYLHDIGKIGVPDAVLLKDGELTAEERAVMRTHVALGVQICAPLQSFRPVLPIIRHHHEHLDGSGYPDGLQGDDIPLLARVFQVADVYDALTNTRPYRRALDVRDAVTTLRGEVEAGWWSRDIVEALVHLLHDRGLAPE